jgi:NAD(P)-dependent dehydrogenase (short-subunit alcohol dehydrogenase family)
MPPFKAGALGPLRFGLTGEVVVVTGGGSGIGRATAELATADGALVAVLDIDKAGIAGTIEGISAAGGTARGYPVDVRDAEGLEATCARVEDELGAIYGLVPCAGTSRPEPAELMPLTTWTGLIDLNLTGMFLTCQSAGRRMLAHGRGAIVTIGSVDSLAGHAARSHYCASKFAVANLTRALALEWGRRGVRVNCLAPGIVDTPLIRRGIPIDQLENVLLDRTPHPRYADALDMAKVALFLLSDAASYVNGAILSADGGLSAGYLNHTFSGVRRAVSTAGQQ